VTRDFKTALGKIKVGLQVNDSPEKKLRSVCRTMADNLPGYDWVGFYLVDKTDHHLLRLGPYVGEPTDHVAIPFGRGICGRAAATREAVIVDDIGQENNYLACSLKVKSEIVVPLFRGTQLVGELDIDSHLPAAFNHQDETFLKEVGRLVETLL